MHDNDRQAICDSFKEVPEIYILETEKLIIKEPLSLKLESVENNEVKVNYGNGRATVPVIFCKHTVFVAKHRNYDYQLFFWINGKGQLKVAFIMDYLSFTDAAKETVQFLIKNPGEYM